MVNIQYHRRIVQIVFLSDLGFVINRNNPICKERVYKLA